MKNWRVLISESARKDFYTLDDSLQKRVKAALESLKLNPFASRSGADIKRIQGSKNPYFYRLRVGGYRLIYTVDEMEVKVTRIMLRKKGYEWL